MALQIALICFLGVVTVTFGITFLVNMQKERSVARLRKIMAAPSPASAASQSTIAKRKELLPTLAKVMSGWQMTERLYKELSTAGWAVRPSEFLGLIVGSAITCQMLALIIFKSVLAFVLFAVVGISLPIMVLKLNQAKRKAAFDGQIVDALEMISSALRSGFSFLRAIQMVSQEMPAPISLEFKRIVYEVNVGRPMEQALRGVVDRTGSYDFDLVVTAVTIQLQVGGDLAGILQTIAETLRDRIQVIGEMKALTAEGKMSGAILMLLPVGLAAALGVMNPEYMSILITDPLGPYVIGAAVLFQIVGGLVIKNMLNLDV